MIDPDACSVLALAGEPAEETPCSLATPVRGKGCLEAFGAIDEGLVATKDWLKLSKPFPNEMPELSQEGAELGHLVIREAGVVPLDVLGGEIDGEGECLDQERQGS